MTTLVRSLLPCLALAASACVGAPTLQQPRPWSAPVTSAKKLFAVWLGPEAIARDTSEMTARTRTLLAGEMDLGTARRTARQLLHEPVRFAAMTTAVKATVAREVDRLGALRHSRGFVAFDPRPDAVRLLADLRRLPELLGLDRRPLGEPDDAQHRTDPDDRHPEAGWAARIWRRIFP